MASLSIGRLSPLRGNCFSKCFTKLPDRFRGSFPSKVWRDFDRRIYLSHLSWLRWQNQRREVMTTSWNIHLGKRKKWQSCSHSAGKTIWECKGIYGISDWLCISGIIYQLLLRNPGHPTIEEELLKAFLAAGTISQEWFDCPQQAWFQRASRTDKGVSAMRMIISLKMREWKKWFLTFKISTNSGDNCW